MKDAIDRRAALGVAASVPTLALRAIVTLADPILTSIERDRIAYGEHGEARQKSQGRAPNFPASRQGRRHGPPSSATYPSFAHDGEAPAVDCRCRLGLDRGGVGQPLHLRHREGHRRLARSKSIPVHTVPAASVPGPDEPDPISTTSTPLTACFMPGARIFARSL
jgi:hypothetical protein